LNFPFYIAKRYVISFSKNKAINIITGIASVGIIASTMALFIFLSVFSGLKEFALNFANATDPDFKIETNNAEEYTASNDNLFVSIIPIQDENLTKDHLAEAVVAMAKELEYDVVDNADEAEMQDLIGYYVMGKKDGVNALLMALMDTESSTNLLVVIVYDDRSERAALKVANSFFAYD